jgi:hypothetical protein
MPIPFEMITLDKPRRLRFGMGAIIEFEKVTGMKLMEIDGSPDTYIKLLWYMLQADEPSLTLKDVCNLVDDYANSIGEVMLLVDKVMDEIFPKVEPDPNAQTPAT